MQTNLTINSKFNDKKVTDKILHINPNITDEQALQLAHAINNLTQSTYDSTTKTTSVDLDSEAKSNRTFTTFTYTCVDNGASRFVPIGDGIINLKLSQLSGADPNGFVGFYLGTTFDSAPYINNLTSTSGSWQFTTITTQQTPPSMWILRIATSARGADVVKGTIHFDASEKFSAFDLDFTITITAD